MESAREIIQSNAVNPKLRADVMEKVLLQGDLSKLTPAERLHYYSSVCTSLGVNPLTKPFEYLSLNGKLILYANRGCTEQLRQIHQVSLSIKTREAVEGCYVVTAMASLPNGRTDESIGAVSLDGLKGENRSNAIMKAETKAKRRATLSICGLTFLDESEVDSIPGAARVEGLDARLPRETDAENNVENRPWRTFKEMLECFARDKEALAADVRVYYEILARHGVKHSNEFHDPATALAAHRELQEAARNFPPAQPTTT